MPIWLRKFTFNQIQEHFDKLNNPPSDNNISGTKTVIDANGKIKAPEFLKNPTLAKRPAKYK